jgi:preprotein translocase subunit SecB
MEQQVKSAKFQFKSFRISKSNIEIKDTNIGKSFDLGFEPKGLINNEDSCFKLQLGVFIEDDDKQMKIEIIAIADFIFDAEISKDDLEKYFYINAPAILFPYIRAYISTLSTLSGISPVTMPTLNMQSLGQELKMNTVENN